MTLILFYELPAQKSATPLRDGVYDGCKKNIDRMVFREPEQSSSEQRNSELKKNRTDSPTAHQISNSPETRQ